RVDCLVTDRSLRAALAGTVLVDTADTVIVFETALPARLYVNPKYVRTDLLHRSTTTSYCNYKGYATYWSAELDGNLFEDVAWSYEQPPPETVPVQGYFSFDETRVDMIAELPEKLGAAKDCGCEV
ncbi:DUF427 domain-containing protein, partial [Mycolicibacterium porcinum]|uniref:DUF427 domain-containing protein n=1 Tax=Mycolicibacterium porcinum TaxID=39693 RepID=UPI001041BED9